MPKIEKFFDEWTSSKKLSEKPKVQLAEIILKAADSLKDLTPEEEKIIKEAEDFLLYNE